MGLLYLFFASVVVPEGDESSGILELCPLNLILDVNIDQELGALQQNTISGFDGMQDALHDAIGLANCEPAGLPVYNDTAVLANRTKIIIF